MTDAALSSCVDDEQKLPMTIEEPTELTWCGAFITPR